jgi:flavin reductase (DIM6/NTAB) family NADH-FMN oxidoreductase RutF
MTDSFRQITPETIGDNVFQLVGDDWMLISAGSSKACNVMTASWGGMGVLWNKKVCFVFIRPTRYTYEFMEKNNHFTLNFLDEEYRDVLNFCGTNSGRELDKVEKCELTPSETVNKAIYFQESRLVIECKKIYFQDLAPQQFLTEDIDSFYPQKDYHRLYIGEIANVLEKIA